MLVWFLSPALSDLFLSFSLFLIHTGVVLWEVMAQKDPWSELPDDNFREQLLQALRQGRRPELPAGSPGDYAVLVQACWATEAGARPPFARVLEYDCLAHIVEGADHTSGVVH